MAETKDKLATLSQVKRLVESQGGGGASLELLWEGESYIYTADAVSDFPDFVQEKFAS